ncbi:MAG: hypothetical protein NTW87_05975 [Planctomycetota bacterium]|nr:hypothetical protein [Planctomycetota bacterium]
MTCLAKVKATAVLVGIVLVSGGVPRAVRAAEAAQDGAAAVTAAAQQKYGGQFTRDIRATPVVSPLLAGGFPGTAFYNVMVHTFAMGIERRSNYCAAYRDGKVVWAYENRPSKPGSPPLSEVAEFCKDLKAADPEAALKLVRTALEVARLTVIEDPAKAPKVGNKEIAIEAPKVAAMKDEASGEEISRVTVFVVRDPELEAVSRFEFDVLKGGGLQQNFHGIREQHVGATRARL